jgi:hypothetical protein
MRELVDASPLVTDTEALRAQLRTDGYLFFPGLLDPKPLTQLREQILDLLGAQGWTREGTDPHEAWPSDPPLIETSPGWWEMYEAVQRLEAFHRLAHSDALVGILGRLFGEDVVVHPQKIARVVVPQDPEATTPAHQDFPNLGGTIDAFTTWIPLADVPREQGGLAVVPGSHTAGVRPLTVDTSKRGAGAIFVDMPREDPRWASVDYAVGDVLVFHSLLVHAGLPNTSDRIRISADFRYQPVSEPIGPWSVQPHVLKPPFDSIPPWEEFTGGWSTTQWVEVPEGVRVIDSPVPLVAGRIGPHVGANDGVSRFIDSTAFAQQVVDQPQLVSVAAPA